MATKKSKSSGKTVTLKDGTVLTGKAAQDYGKTPSTNTKTSTSGGSGSVPSVPTPSSYSIKYGDTLSGIAARNNTTVQQLLSLNPTISDPNKIMAGASLNLPGLNTTGTPNLSEIQKQAEEIQRQADALKNQGKTSDGSVVSSSSKKRAEESKIKSDLDKLNPTSVGESKLRAASDNYIKEIDAQLKQLESQRAGDIAGINANFDETRRQTEDTQVREKGSTTVSLARIGGYLGNSASSVGAMLNLAQTHKNEILSLEQKRNAALQEANNAYNERRFEFVKLKLNEAKDIEKEVLARKDKFFEQTLDLTTARQKEDEYFREKYKDDLEALALVDGEASPEKMDEIDRFYGVPGFSKRYMEITKSTNEAKTEKAALENRKNLLGLLKDIPAGQTVRFPDGTEYTGMGSAGDITTTLQVDDSGVGRIVAYNKLTGATNVTNVGSVGKSKGGGSSPSSVPAAARDNVVGMLQMRLEESKLEDGTYDPDTYINERKLIKEAYPQLTQYVDNLFLNKSYGFFGDEAIVRLRKSGVYYGDQPLLGVDEQPTDSDGDGVSDMDE